MSPRVPGTFKERPTARRLQEVGRYSDVANALREAGASDVQFWIVGECNVMLCREPLGLVLDPAQQKPSLRWHLSISHQWRYPTWDEIKTARYSIPAIVDVPIMAQLLPSEEAAGGHWTNLHENCFHLYEIHDQIDLEIT